ncbi:membrane copper amine oxidase [Paraphaeosphaeria sporulosa]|uniref:Amine oxidase n=1 Tax=Paraphaeosphaeria sporulosa TaxID=1460663 RepID=A0A177CE72_9PLEO|nr:membrane copper amine oxidase [Paraphaeosphaeria sporulosa]OAG05511.1 membrane copper amine oxidase [Paraphaeosphaeria sporulosa]
MKFHPAVPALFLSIVPVLVHGAPAPEAKANWVKSGRGHRVIPHDSRQAKRQYLNTTSPEAPGCGDAAPAVTAPIPNVWEGFTDEEAASVVYWLFEQSDLNLTTSEKAGEWDNSVLLVELQRPNKTDVVAYLDGSGPAPDRYAHVLLNIRATEEPYYADILVGPLPVIANVTTWQPLDYYHTRKTEGRVRNLSANDDTLYEKLLYPTSASIKDITLELWGGSALGYDNDTITMWGIDPMGQEDGRITSWYMFVHKSATGFDTTSILSLGLYFLVDQSGRDPTQWKVLGWFYNDIWYDSTEAFKNAFYSPGFVKLPINIDGPWATTDQSGPILPKDTLSPPMAIAPAGSRYSVDVNEKYVEWMDFSFYVGFSRDTGLALYDIKYKGDRIIYELGLQEALAHYAGADPYQSGTAYLDSYYGFGPYAFQLVEGYDCPAYATYLNSSFYVDETTHTHVNSICLFEFDADYPQQRHSTTNYVSSTKNTYFSLRSVSTIGNYDYMFTYSFYQDGTVGVEVRASGYIQGAYYANNQDYGWHIHDALSGSMHDHVLNFKADFDILGTANTVQLVKNVATTETYPWSQGKPRNTMKLQKSFIESEDESRINFGENALTQVIIVNQNETNKYGENRGYRILPSSGTAHLTVQNSSSAVNSANWAGYDIQFTKQKDTELSSSHPYNSQDVNDPPINFDHFFNGESLVQDDLVAWINLGMHHIPHTGDLPNTVFTTAHSGVQFMPLNYLLGDASRQTVNQVRINYDAGKATAVETFGQKTDTCPLNNEIVDVNKELWEYVGDVVVRKYPYDPNHPFEEVLGID